MSSTHLDIASNVRAPSVPRSHRLSACFGLLLVCWIFLVLSEQLLSAPSGAGGGVLLRRSLFAALTAGGLVAAFTWRRPLVRLVASVPFSFSVLVALLGMTMLGTVVLQGAEPAEYHERYGVLAPALLGLGLNDLFHTLWFQGFLGLAALSLVVVAITRQAWRMPMWGHLACHMGVVTILLGGLIGSLTGQKGVIDLRESEVATDFVVTQAGRPTGERVPLGFALRLEDFEIERRDPEFRLQAFTKAGEGYRLASSFGVDELSEWRHLDEAGVDVRVVQSFPDFHVEHRLLEVPPDKGSPALRIRLPHDEDVHTHDLVLFAGQPERESAELWPGGPRVRLVWERPSDEQVERLAQQREAGHRLRFSLDAGAIGDELPVEIGGNYTLAGGRFQVRVVESLPDFTYDVDSGQAMTRSDRPDNPALRVEVRRQGVESSETRWLFAKMPDYQSSHGGGQGEEELQLVYAFEPGSAPLEKELLVIGSALETWELQSGVVADTVAFGDGQPVLPGVPEAELELLASAIEEPVPVTGSDEWNNPVLQVEVRHGDSVHEAWIASESSDPTWIDQGLNALVFQRKADDIKDYRSTLTVVADGQDALTKTIEVNDPLEWGGYLFYQSSYREEDPTYTGLQVVRDPGYPVVFAGFVMIALGLIYVYYMRQRLLRRRI